MFVIDILEQYESINYQDLLNIEDDYIKQYNTLNPDFGYNSKLNIDQFTILSKTSIEKREEKIKQKYKKVMSFDYKTGEFFKEFKSVTEAAVYFNTSTSNISGVCNNKINYIKGYVFCYSNEYNSNKCYKYVKVKRQMSEKEKQIHRETSSRAKKVYEYSEYGQLLNIYFSRSDCERNLNLNKENLENILKIINIFNLIINYILILKSILIILMKYEINRIINKRYSLVP